VGVRVIYVVEGRIEQPYACRHCAATAVARVHVVGSADAGPGERVEAARSALELAALALEVSECPSCGRRGVAWRREWTTAATLWLATIALAGLAYFVYGEPGPSSEPLRDLQLVAIGFGLAAIALCAVAITRTIGTYGLPQRVQWLDVAHPPKKKKRTRRRA
jgi:ribosomal protein L37AE/L43A